MSNTNLPDLPLDDGIPSVKMETPERSADEVLESRLQELAVLRSQLLQNKGDPAQIQQLDEEISAIHNLKRCFGLAV